MVAHGSELRRVQVLHVKRRAQEALDAKDYRLARDRYTQALHLCTRSTDHMQKATTSSTQAPSPTSYHDRQEAKLLLCNRSLVELLAGHPQAALADAEAALALAPAWPKAHWRVGKAAAALGYWPQAVQAYLYAWRLTTDPNDKEACNQQLMRAVCNLTRQQLADSILCLLGCKQVEGAPDTTAGVPAASGCEGAVQLDSCPGLCRPAAQLPGTVQEELYPSGWDTGLPLLPGSQQQQLCDNHPHPCGSNRSSSGSSSSSDGGSSMVCTLSSSSSGTADAMVCSFASPEGSIITAEAHQLVVVDGVAAPAAWWQQQQLLEAMYRLVKAGERVKALGGQVGRYQADYKRWLQAGRVPQEEQLLLQAVMAVQVKQWEQALSAAAAALRLLRTQAYKDEDLLCGLLIEAHTTLAQAATGAAAQSHPACAPSATTSSNSSSSRDTIPGIHGRSKATRRHQAAACALLTALDLLPPLLDPPPMGTTAAAAGGKLMQQREHVWGHLLSSPKYIQEQQQQLQHRLEAAQQQLSEQQQHQVYAWLAAGSDWLQLLLGNAGPNSSMSSSAEGQDAARPSVVGSAAPNRAATTSASNAGDIMQACSSKDSDSSSKHAPANRLALRMLGLSLSAGDSQQQVLEVMLTWGPEADMQTLSGEPRLAARKLLAAALGVPLTSVLLRGVHTTPSGALHLEAHLVYTVEHQDAVTALMSRCGVTPQVADTSTKQLPALRLPHVAHTAEGVPAAAALALKDDGRVVADDGEYACLRLQACRVVAAPQVSLDVASNTAATDQAVGQSTKQPASEGQRGASSHKHLQQQQAQQQQQEQQQLPHNSKCLAAVHPPTTPLEPEATLLMGEAQQPLVTTQAREAALVSPETPEVSLALPLPYAHYQLTTADGRPLERPDKHPFCFSRVMYSPQDCGVSEEVWAQMEGLGCRWRQSASEVKVLLTSLPPGVTAKMLRVTIQPYQVEVRHRVTGEVYLEGDLERGVVPEDSCWVMEEEGLLLLLLAKMNLELYESPWQHSASWWPRLFRDDPVQVAWDDYDKDYSDLPPAIAAAHAAATARQERQNAEEAAEKDRRKAVQDVVERAMRERRERLAQLRSWFWRRTSLSEVEAA